MKLRNLLISSAIALGLVASVGVALKAAPKSEAVSADADTWMFAVDIDMSEPYNWGSTISGEQFHVWGTNLDKWVDLHNSGVENVLTAMVTLNDTQEVHGGQFLFKENGNDKYSSDLVFTATKDEHSFERYWSTSGMSWTGDKWNPTNGGEGYLQIDFASSPKFSEDPANQRFIVTLNDVSASAAFGLRYRGTWNHTFELTRTSDADLFNGHAAHWFSFKDAGTYDVILENNYVDGGILTVKKHSVVDTYIYYLSESNFGADDTPNYIYSWGVSEQFGSWPGSKIADVATEVTNKGVLRFGGNYGEYSDQSQYIYKIPVKIGYPGGDNMFKLKSGTDSSESSEFAIEGGKAYKWTANESAAADGAAIDFLVKVEEKRNAVSASGDVWAYSVCGISKGNAASLWNEYDGLDSAVKAKVDSAEVYTYQKTAHEEGDSSKNGLISYADVMDELARIGQVGLYSSPSPMINHADESNSALTIVIIASVIAATSLLGVALIIRKRKVQ